MHAALQILALVLVAVAMALSLAHALELPGKLRLDREAYLATQPIYYPGFTFGGLAEPLGIVVLLALAAFTPSGTAFWLTAAALLALAASHLTYWLLTHPVNNFWLKGHKLGAAGSGFFSFALGGVDANDWRALRDRWEYSHVLRAALAAASFLFLAAAIVM